MHSLFLPTSNPIILFKSLNLLTCLVSLQWHLLEHAFDVILESGDIPHSDLFMELVIQATAQHNYERASVLVNTMAFAPFQVSEKQWTDLFKENQDRISHENLEQLLDAIGNCDVVYEATISNLSRSLHFLCGGVGTRYISSTSDIGSENTVCNQNEGTDDGRNSDMPIDSGKINKSIESKKDHVYSVHAKPDAISFHDNCIDRDNGDFAIDTGPQNSDIEGRSLCIDRVGFADDQESDKSYDILYEDWDLCDGSTDDADEAKPSAYEILEEWKKRRKEDWSYFQSQLGSTK